MNIDRGKESFTPEEIAELRDRLDAFKTANGFSWNTIAAKTQVAFGTISQWVPGTYKGDNQAIAAKINRFFLHVEHQAELAQVAGKAPDFILTETARQVIGTLGWAHRGKFVVVVGDPGVGKTAAIDQYVGTNPNVWKTTISPSTASVNAMLLSTLRGMGSTRQFGSGHSLSMLVREKLGARSSVLIIDEAQHLHESALEELRSIHDETKCGLALVGNREVLTRIEGAQRAAAFAQLYSRVSLRLVIPRPHDQDVDLILNAWDVHDPKERDFLRRVALKPGSGGVRSLTNTLEYATMMALQGQDEARCLEHLQSAWSALSTRSATA